MTDKYDDSNEDEWNDPPGVWEDEPAASEPADDDTADASGAGARQFAVGLTIIAAAVWFHLSGHQHLGVALFLGFVAYDLSCQIISAYRNRHND